MKVLILTNPTHVDFVAAYTLETMQAGDEALFKYTGEYDWLGEDYDIGISFMYQHKVPAKEVNSHTWFNFHPAPLPKYKGRNLCYHAIMNGETEFGATLHYMDENFDTGDIIDVWKFFIAEWWNAQDLSEQAIIKSKSMFKDYFPRIVSGEQFERLPNVGGTYYLKTGIADDIRVPEWVQKRIRAITYGEHYAYTYVGGVKYKIVRDE